MSREAAPVATAGGEPVSGVTLLSTPREGHLWQIDVVRLLTFAAVIAVHALAFTADPSDEGAGALMMMLQFGREVFFALTGFVLVYSSLGRPLRVGSFWRKRFLYVGVPYVVWSVIYYAFTFVNGPHPPFSWSTFGADLINGNAEYHLYFLLVSLQLYLVFPLVMRFVRATAHRPFLVLGIVGGLNATWLGVLQWVPWPSGWGRFLWTQAFELLPTYSVYVLAGCYAAVHREKLLVVLRANRRRVIRLAAAGLVVTEAVYLIQSLWLDPRDANNPLQPVMIVGSISVVMLLVSVGDAWSEGPRRGIAAIRRGSDISFGVYLFHPIVLALVCDAGLGNGLNSLPAGVPTVVAAAGTAAGAVAVALILRRTPLALPLIGRAWARPCRLGERNRGPAAAGLPAAAWTRACPLGRAEAQLSDIVQEPLMPSSGLLGTTR